MTQRLTKSTIDRAQYKGHQYRGGGWSRCFVWDDRVTGFGIRVYPSGKKTFVFQYRHRGRSRLYTIGDYGPLTLDQARKKANGLKSDVALHESDPVAKREQKRGEMAFGEFVGEYIERHAKMHKRSWRQDETRIQRHLLKPWRKVVLSAIERRDVARLHHKIGARAPYEANRVLALASKMFECAKTWGYLSENAPNPALRITKYAERTRDRWLSEQEIRQIASTIREEPNVYVQGAIWLYLLTGVRRSELLRARWSDIDFERRELRLPETKSGKPKHIPLSADAISLLKRLPRAAGNEHVLPGSKPGHHMVNIDKPWRRICDKAGIDDIRIHDLRRTVGSMMVQSGNSLYIVQKALNHGDPSTTQIYARLGDEPVRKAFDDHGHALTVALGGPIEIMVHNSIHE